MYEEPYKLLWSNSVTGENDEKIFMFCPSTFVSFYMKRDRPKLLHLRKKEISSSKQSHTVSMSKDSTVEPSFLELG